MNTTDDFLAAVAALVDHDRPTDLYCGAAAAAVDELLHNWRDWSKHDANFPTVACLRDMTLADLAQTIDALDILRRSIAGIGVTSNRRTVRITAEVSVEADNDTAAIRAAVESAREGEFTVVAHEIIDPKMNV